MNNVGLNINVNIKIKVRIRVLYDVIEHLCRAFNFPDDMYSTLYKGIVDRQILKSVYAYYLDDNDKAVGIVKFNIDWLFTQHLCHHCPSVSSRQDIIF